MRAPLLSQSRLIGRLAAALLLGAAIDAFAASSEAPVPMTPADLKALVRTGQLARWFPEPLTQVQALCIQSEWTSAWPEDGNAPERERDADALRRAREKCVVTWPEPPASVPVGGDPDLRFIAQWRADFLSRTRHLLTVKQALANCIAGDARRSVDMTCLQRAAGQPMSQRDLESLVLALPRKP